MLLYVVLAYALASWDNHLKPALRTTREVTWRLTQLAVILTLRVTQGFATRHAYRTENRRREISHHRYARGKTPLAYSWDSIRLCIMTEKMDSRRSRFLLGYTLVDSRAA